MYLPENHAQMFDILSELRLYAAMNALPGLAEELDDALMLLATEGRSRRRREALATVAEDGR
jgi:hypothetical protein